MSQSLARDDLPTLHHSRTTANQHDHDHDRDHDHDHDHDYDPNPLGPRAALRPVVRGGTVGPTPAEVSTSSRPKSSRYPTLSSSNPVRVNSVALMLNCGVAVPPAHPTRSFFITLRLSHLLKSGHAEPQGYSHLLSLSLNSTA